MKYSASKNSMSLKTWLWVVQGQMARFELYTTFYWSTTTYIAPCTVWVIWRWIIPWPWNLG